MAQNAKIKIFKTRTPVYRMRCLYGKEEGKQLNKILLCSRVYSKTFRAFI